MYGNIRSDIRKHSNVSLTLMRCEYGANIYIHILMRALQVHESTQMPVSAVNSMLKHVGQ